MKKALVTCCHNQLEVTKRFLNSVISELDSSYDLYILDNGSTDGTYEYVKKVQNDLLDNQIEIYGLRSETNLGFAGGNNMLLKWLLKNNKEFAELNHQTQDYYSNVILINNNTLITKSAIEKLIEVCNSNSTIGATGPVSNRVSGSQFQLDLAKVSDTNYKQIADARASSKDIHASEVNTLIGFCLCLKTSVLKNVGLLDEQFGIGCWEDNDYSLAIRIAGYRLAIVLESFIYHYGSQTIRNFDMKNLMIDNKYKFINKYKWRNGNSKLSIIHMIKEGEKDLNKPFIEDAYYIKHVYKNDPTVPQEVLKEAYQNSDWCLLTYNNDQGMTLTKEKIIDLIDNCLPDRDLFKFKICHINSDKTIDIKKNPLDWQGRLLRLKQRPDGSIPNFNEIPSNGISYAYETIYSVEDLNLLGNFLPSYHVHISAPLIVKNEEKYIRNCLESLKDFVDEIIIVDTGSTDKTKEICKEYTDKIYDYKWDDNFANARNFSLSKCKYNWILRVDGDEELTPSFKVDAYNEMINNVADAYLIPIQNIQPDGSTPLSTTLRLFKANKDIQYTGRVHEEIDESIKSLGYRVKKFNTYIQHYGYLKGIQDKKTDLYFKLLTLDYQDNPNNFKTLMNLATHYVHQKKYDTAIGFYEDCIKNGGDVDPIILHDYGVAKYKSFLAKHQTEIKEILSIFDKARTNVSTCYPQQVAQYEKNYNLIKGMVL